MSNNYRCRKLWKYCFLAFKLMVLSFCLGVAKNIFADDNPFLYITSINKSDRPIVSCICVYTCKALADALAENAILNKNLYLYENDETYDGTNASDAKFGSIAQALGYIYNGKASGGGTGDGSYSGSDVWGDNRLQAAKNKYCVNGIYEQFTIAPKRAPYIDTFKFQDMPYGFTMMSDSPDGYGTVISGPERGGSNSNGAWVNNRTQSQRKTIGDYLGNLSMLRTYAPWGIYVLYPGYQYTVKVDETFCLNAGYTPNNLKSRTADQESGYYYSFFPFLSSFNNNLGDDGPVTTFADNWRSVSMEDFPTSGGAHTVYVHYGSSLSNTGLAAFAKPLTCNSDDSRPQCEYSKQKNPDPSVSVQVDLTAGPVGAGTYDQTSLYSNSQAVRVYDKNSTGNSIFLYSQDYQQGFCSWPTMGAVIGNNITYSLDFNHPNLPIFNGRYYIMNPGACWQVNSPNAYYREHLENGTLHSDGGVDLGYLQNFCAPNGKGANVNGWNQSPSYRSQNTNVPSGAAGAGRVTPGGLGVLANYHAQEAPTKAWHLDGTNTWDNLPYFAAVRLCTQKTTPSELTIIYASSRIISNNSDVAAKTAKYVPGWAYGAGDNCLPYITQADFAKSYVQAAKKCNTEGDTACTGAFTGVTITPSSRTSKPQTLFHPLFMRQDLLIKKHTTDFPVVCAKDNTTISILTCASCDQYDYDVSDGGDFALGGAYTISTYDTQPWNQTGSWGMVPLSPGGNIWGTNGSWENIVGVLFEEDYPIKSCDDAPSGDGWKMGIRFRTCFIKDGDGGAKNCGDPNYTKGYWRWLLQSY